MPDFARVYAHGSAWRYPAAACDRHVWQLGQEAPAHVRGIGDVIAPTGRDRIVAEKCGQLCKAIPSQSLRRVAYFDRTSGDFAKQAEAAHLQSCRATQKCQLLASVSVSAKATHEVGEAICWVDDIEGKPSM